MRATGQRIDEGQQAHPAVTGACFSGLVYHAGHHAGQSPDWAICYSYGRKGGCMLFDRQYLVGIPSPIEDRHWGGRIIDGRTARGPTALIGSLYTHYQEAVVYTEAT